MRVGDRLGTSIPDATTGPAASSLQHDHRHQREPNHHRNQEVHSAEYQEQGHGGRPQAVPICDRVGRPRHEQPTLGRLQVVRALRPSDGEAEALAVLHGLRLHQRATRARRGRLAAREAPPGLAAVRSRDPEADFTQPVAAQRRDWRDAIHCGGGRIDVGIAEGSRLVHAGAVLEHEGGPVHAPSRGLGRQHVEVRGAHAEAPVLAQGLHRRVHPHHQPNQHRGNAEQAQDDLRVVPELVVPVDEGHGEPDHHRRDEPHRSNLPVRPGQQVADKDEEQARPRHQDELPDVDLGLRWAGAGTASAPQDGVLAGHPLLVSRMASALGRPVRPAAI
mmetsp:Transcript_80381/g.217741  ORF Transcript_80381/g.217741 Transcript_80381/m.217741 type:complete len:333 (-) Transcript_80381:25-1023(-)